MTPSFYIVPENIQRMMISGAMESFNDTRCTKYVESAKNKCNVPHNLRLKKKENNYEMKKLEKKINE